MEAERGAIVLYQLLFCLVLNFGAELGLVERVIFAFGPSFQVVEPYLPTLVDRILFGQ